MWVKVKQGDRARPWRAWKAKLRGPDSILRVMENRVYDRISGPQAKLPCPIMEVRSLTNVGLW